VDLIDNNRRAGTEMDQNADGSSSMIRPLVMLETMFNALASAVESKGTGVARAPVSFLRPAHSRKP